MKWRSTLRLQKIFLLGKKIFQIAYSCILSFSLFVKKTFTLKRNYLLQHLLLTCCLSQVVASHTHTNLLWLQLLEWALVKIGLRIIWKIFIVRFVHKDFFFFFGLKIIFLSKIFSLVGGQFTVQNFLSCWAY